MSIRPASRLCSQLRSTSSPLRLQRRWARVHDVRFVAARHNTTSSPQDRYQDKLKQKAREEGFESVEHLKAAYDERIKLLRKRVSKELEKATSPEAQAQAAQAQAQTTGQEQTQSPWQGQQPPPPVPEPLAPPNEQGVKSQPQASTQPQPSKKDTGGTPGIKPLSSYLDLPKISALPAKEIEYLWRLRHASDPKSLCAVMSLATYNRIHGTAKTHPRFVLPLPRPAEDDGSGDIKQDAEGFTGGVPRTASDIHFLQWGFHPPAGPPAPPGVQTGNTHTSTILFTHLAAFKLHGEYATPHTVVTHHLDLADSHGLVLLNGSVMEGGGVSVEEGKWLLLCMQKFYDQGGHGGGVGVEKRQGLLRKFSEGDSSFDLAELVDEAERIS